MENSEPKELRFPWKGLIVGLGTAIVALVLVLTKVANPAEIFAELQDYPSEYFVAALACIVASWALDGVRMRSLTEASGATISWWSMILTLLASTFLTLVTPFAAGGGPFVAYMLYRAGRSVPQATAVVAAGGYAAQGALTILASLVLALLIDLPGEAGDYIGLVQVGFGVYFVIVAGLAYLTYQGKYIQHLFGKKQVASAWIGELVIAYREIFTQKGLYFVRAFVAAFAYYGLHYLAGYMLLSGFGVGKGIVRYGVSLLLGVAPIISPIPGGAGAAEFIAFHVLDEYLPADQVGTFIVLWRAVVFYLPVIVGGSLFVSLVLRWTHRAIKK